MKICSLCGHRKRRVAKRKPRLHPLFDRAGVDLPILRKPDKFATPSYPFAGPLAA